MWPISPLPWTYHNPTLPQVTREVIDAGAKELQEAAKKSTEQIQRDGRWMWKQMSRALYDKDAVVAKAMADRWAAFASHGDPNYELKPKDVEWPIWFDDTALSAAGGLSSKRQVEEHRKRARRQERRNRKRGRAAGAGVGSGAGAAGTTSTVVGKGPEYLEIGSPPSVRPVGRDCFCEFWDSLEYRY